MTLISIFQLKMPLIRSDFSPFSNLQKIIYFDVEKFPMFFFLSGNLQRPPLWEVMKLGNLRRIDLPLLSRTLCYSFKFLVQFTLPF